MSFDSQIEMYLERALSTAENAGGPPLLSAALRHAVFPGGARVRPQLCLAVAHACDPESDLTDALASAAALELLHCASLVHDDLPCFDDAAQRRGKPSVHAKYGENLAVLAGDALIVMSFQLVAVHARDYLADLIVVLSEAAAPPYGIAAGQAWESEPVIDLEAYHEAKTSALFIAAARAGARSVGQDDGPWRQLGLKLGEAYQLADDIRDAVLTPEELGKPANQDLRNGRPNAVAEFGLDGAYDRMLAAVEAAAASVPACAGTQQLRQLIHAQAKRLVPANLDQLVA
jgi:geranylgeranyl diphosphate synthase type II